MRTPHPSSLLLLALLASACHEGDVGIDAGADAGADAGDPPAVVHPALELADEGPVDVGEPLAAGFDEPVLLTLAAARARTEYVPDSGYTLGAPEGGLLPIVADDAGALLIGLEVDGTDLPFPDETTIATTTSDGAILRFASDALGTQIEVRVAVVTSRVLAVEVRATGARRLTVRAALRSCDDLFLDPTETDDGLAMAHRPTIDPLSAGVGPGTYVDFFRGALVARGGAWTARGLVSCGSDPRADVDAASTGALTAARLAMVVVEASVEATEGSPAILRIERALTPRSDEPAAALSAARAVALPAVIADGLARIERRPTLASSDRVEQLVHRSSYVLLDQLSMPAEGMLAHDYYVFSREPAFWFGRLGQHEHESLSLLATARLDPELARESQRSFFDRQEANGWIPYNIGPVLESAPLGTATAPLLAYVSWGIYQAAPDAVFLAEAYEAGRRFLGFWESERDVDGDGLAEFGGLALSESLRDMRSVVYTQVATPDMLESVDLNSMLVVEARTLASMAEELSRPADEVTDLRARADARAARIEAQMWDETTGFYYQTDRVDGDMTIATERDLVRPEIVGLLPLWAGVAAPDRRARLLEQLQDPSRFGRTFGIPGLSADDPLYTPRPADCCQWSGPMWVPWTLLIVRGLRDAGEDALADSISRTTIDAVAAQLRSVHQFRETYDPDDASRPNDSMPNYIWSALAAVLAEERTDLR